MSDGLQDRGGAETNGPASSELALLCFGLHAASRAMTAVYRPLLEEVGLTYPQYLVMLLLWEDDPRGVKELGRVLELDSGTLSPLLKRLEAAGLVRRERRAADEREVEVTLTPEGRALRERARHIPRAIEQATGLSDEGIEELRVRLAELRAALRRAPTG
ncbi:MarR family transcriptional regulator [Rubrobacter marinus]|uniref:MarR family transcriptional regulator n=1 Tax=Rubrobacter marinus TaxID=2653852 RepID=A0A6G8Q2K6_9ACTN|nr:MarR family transcriptional regulator [Rubrobacter marinus]